MATAPTEPRTDLDAVMEEAAAAGREAAAEGEVDTSDPKLGSTCSPDAFAITLAELDGTDHVLGDVDVRFPIQSISKMFALVLAMQKVDRTSLVSDELWARIGREPSGDPFNSLVQLEHEKGIPRNPMINAGALVIDDVLVEFCDDPKRQLTELVSELAEDEIEVDPVVADAELESSHRNLAVANLMASFGNLRNPVMDVLEVYVHQCALAMSTRQLAHAVRFLANDGVDPASGRRVLPDILARRVNSLMLTCGTYDAAGAFAFEVGLPCKSGVAGGIVGVVPDQMGVCVWSPALDDTGNSHGGRVALHELAEKLHLSIF
ncbi:glutaminase [Nitriliruptor alkaliphilus]|uniref:glutaminase n=1 Tax=Nitriliruptor alkaliphilus TaxID=427918 RepID=UPI000A547795|nr:glutaminase [Nitriliruptor alkaliphilus]